MIKLITNTGSVHHYGESATGEKGYGPRALCGRETLREGHGAEVSGRGCKSCIRVMERQKIIAEMTREAIASTNPEHPEAQPAPAPTMHYGVSRILCGATLEYVGSDHCKGGDDPCSAACDCGCSTGEFECLCDNATDIVAEVTCKPCKEALHRPVDARSDAMMEQTASDDRTAPQDAVWDRESTERALSGSELGAPELNTGHAPLYDFPVTVRRVQPTPTPNKPQKPAWRVVDANTGETVTLPTTRPDFRGDMGTVTGIADHPQPGKSGKLYHDRIGQVCYPGVYGLKIVPNN